jgi:hypothetical protein
VVAAIALAEGLLGIWDIDHRVASGAWVALALAIVGIGLVIGAYVGRPGGLILIGLPLIPALIASSVLGGAHWETRTVTYTPTTSASLLSGYDITNGRLDLDLSSVSDPKALDGRNVDLSLGAGKITVELPPGTRAEVDAAIRYGGEIQVGNRDQSGFNSHLVTTVASAGAAADAPTVHLTIRARVGQIYIEGN